MSEYKMDIKGIIGLSDYSSINDYIGLVDYDEKFTITLDNLATESLEIIESMLRDNDFFITHKGIDTEGKYCINAQKCSINNNKLTM